MNNREYLSLEGVGLELNQTRRIVCPWCMGGTSGESSMNLTRTTSGLAYNCHRASCGVRGYVEGGLNVLPMIGAEPVGRKDRVYTGPVLPLTLDDFRYFDTRYELGATDVAGKIYRSFDGRYILPIFWRGEDRGYVLRKPWEGAPVEQPWKGKKADVYLHDSETTQQALYYDLELDTPGNPSHYAYIRRVVIVEDQLSAMKAAKQNLLGVALLGSTLNLEKVREIQRLRPDEVIFALDTDATSLSFKYAREFGTAFKQSRVAILDRDLKDTKLADIPAALSL